MLPRADRGQLFGIREEYVTLAIIAPLILSCMLVDPILVSVENFNNGQPSALLTYTTGPQNQSFEFNISRHVAEGNWSHDGIFRNFTIEMCPVSGAPSELRLYFPETGNSELLKTGVLTGCEQFTVATDGFDPYFNTTTGTVLNFLWLSDFIGKGGLEELNTMMLKNPKMYRPSEAVDYTVLVPFFQAHEVRYRCYAGDSERAVTTPAREWDILLPLPGGLGGAPPIPIIMENGTVKARASLWDLPCPAYGAEGKYRGRVTKVHLYLENQSWPEYFNFTDDFDSVTFNTSAWDMHTANGSISTGHFTSGSNFVMRSPLVATAIYSYYSRNVTANDTERFDLSVNVSNAEIPGGMSGIGAIVFTNGIVDPGSSGEIGQNVSKVVMFNGSIAALICNMSEGPMAAAAITPGYHVFRVNSSGKNMTVYVDGALLGNCSGELGINETVYYMFSPDPLTDQYYGNLSVEWANMTVYDWNGSDWVESSYFDHFNAALNTTAWIVRNNSIAGYAYHVNNWTESKLDLFSDSPANSTGIIAFYNDLIPAASGTGTAFMINVTLNNSEMSGDRGFVLLSRSKFAPTTAVLLSDEVEGAVLYNQTDYEVYCDYNAGSPPDLTGTFAGPVSAMGMAYAEGGSVEYLVDGSALSCPSPSFDYYFGFSPDPMTDYANGNASIGNVSILSLSLQNVTGWRWLDFESDDYGYFVQAFNFTLDSYSDVIIRDCTDRWNCAYEFNLSSDTAGAVNVSIVNITYENLIGYNGGRPAMTIDGSSSFSWMGSNSTIANSDVRYQSGIFDSRITDSEVILSDVYCTNVSDSLVHGSVRLAEFNNESIGGAVPISVPSIRFDPHPCGEIVNSNVSGVFLLSGSVYDSRIVGGAGLFMDFYGADLENYTLRSGRAVLNVTKYGAHAAEWLTAMGMDNQSIDLSTLGGLLPGLVLPVGCEEGAVFAAEGFPEARLGNVQAPFSCLVELHRIHLVFTNMTVVGSSVGGPVISLDNASFTIDNQSGSFNLMMQGQGSNILFWNLDTGSGPLTFNSSHQYVEADVVALDAAFYDWTDGRVVTIIFENAAGPDTPIYYYPGFTDNHGLIVNSGVRCDAARCQNVTWDGATLRFNVTNFSSYALGGAPAPPSSGGDGEEQLSASLSASCEGNNITVRSGQSPVSGVRVSVIDDATLGSIFTGTTDTNGVVQFESCGSFVRIHASRDGYLPASTSGTLVSCGSCAAPEQNETGLQEAAGPGCVSDSECEYNQRCSAGKCTDISPGGTCGYFENHAWLSYGCCSDADCEANMTCVSHACVEVEAQPPTEPPAQPPSQPPAQPPQAPPAGEVGGVAGPEPVCCLLGICGTYLGVCWYWWMLLFILLVAALGAAVLAKGFFMKRRR